MLAASAPVRNTASMACKKYLPWRNRARHEGGRARQYRGLFSGRRRWRSVARLACQCPRMVKFHNTIPHPHSRNLLPQHSGTRILVLSLLAGQACAELVFPLPPGLLVDSLTFIVKVVDICAHRLHYGLAAAILRSSARRFRIAEYSNRPPQVT